MAGRFAAAGLEVVDRTLEEFADLQQRFDELALLVLPLTEELSLATGAFGPRG